MDAFKSLIITIKRLLGPNGCPWDREQTMQTIRSSLLEETYEVIEAIDLNHPQQIQEELGDLLFNIIFLSELGAKEGHFNLEDVIRQINAKLIRRHPHIFGEAQVETSDQVVKQWEAIKQQEYEHRTSLLDGIPKDLPALARAQKVAKRFAKAGFTPSFEKGDSLEDQMGQQLWQLSEQSVQQGVDLEQALIKHVAHLSAAFRQQEKKD